LVYKHYLFCCDYLTLSLIGQTELTSGTEEVQKGAINLNVSAGDLTFGDIDDR